MSDYNVFPFNPDGQPSFTMTVQSAEIPDPEIMAYLMSQVKLSQRYSLRVNGTEYVGMFTRDPDGLLFVGDIEWQSPEVQEQLRVTGDDHVEINIYIEKVTVLEGTTE